MVNIPIVNAPYLNVDGLEIAITGNTTATVQIGRARNSTNENDIIMDYTTASEFTTATAVTLDAANQGLNGIDTGALANTTLYSLFVVGDSTNTNLPGALLSLSSDPLLPVGYDMFRLIGYIRTDGSAHFLPGYFSGSGNNRIFMYDAPLATAVTAGASTTDAPVALGGLVPAIPGTPVYVYYDMTPAAASRVLTLKPFGATGAPFTATSQVTAVHVTGVALVQAQLVIGIPNLEYIWSAGGGDAVALSVAGYQYTI